MQAGIVGQRALDRIAKEMESIMKAKGMKSTVKNIVRCSPVPEFITCPGCGYDMEFWLDAEETRCLFCGHRFFRRETTVH